MHFSDPDLYYKAIHEDSIPDVEAEEQGIVFLLLFTVDLIRKTLLAPKNESDSRVL